MAAATTSETYDALWTLTMRAKRKRLTDNISDAYPTIGEFRKSGLIETETGGKQIQEDLMYALQGGQWFDTYDVLATDRIDGITAAFYDWSYLAVPIVISHVEEMENRESDRAVKLIEAKTTQAMQGAFDTANASLHSAQSGKSMLGIQDIIVTGSSTETGQLGDGTVGGITSAVGTNDWWMNQVDNDSATFLTKTGDVEQGILKMGVMWNLCSEGNESPDLILTNYDLYGNYEAVFEGTSRLRTTAGGSNNLDGRNPTYRGATVVPDRDAAAGNMYFINKKFIKLKVQAGMNFAKTPFEKPTNQLAKVAFVVAGMQLTTNHRARLGCSSTITAS